MTAPSPSAVPAPASFRARVRAARPADIPGICALIRHYSEQGILLPRTPQDVQANIGDFRVISSKGATLACAVLHFYTPQVAELRSLAVAPALRGRGLGGRIVAALLAEARARRLQMVFAFTYQVDFFARFSFQPIDRALVPWKAWKDCLLCPKRECCDETAVACWLEPGHRRVPPSPFRILAGHNK